MGEETEQDWSGSGEEMSWHKRERACLVIQGNTALRMQAVSIATKGVQRVYRCQQQAGRPCQ